MEQTNKNWIKNCLGYSNKNTYSTEAGNGMAIIEHKEVKEAKEMSDGNFVIISHTELKKDETGKQSYRNLYEEIQDMKESVDFEKILNNNMNFDQIKLAIDNNKNLFKPITPEYTGDFSDHATVEKIQQIKNDANLSGKNYSDFVKNSNKVIQKYNNLFEIYNKQKKELEQLRKFQQYQKTSDKSQK